MSGIDSRSCRLGHGDSGLHVLVLRLRASIEFVGALGFLSSLFLFLNSGLFLFLQLLVDRCLPLSCNEYFQKFCKDKIQSSSIASDDS